MSKEFFSLEGKVAIITGGARGLGKAIAEAFVSAGANSLIADINETAAAETSEEFAGKGPEVKAKYVDISAEKSVDEMVDFALKHFGKIDILVNNAGIGGGEPAPEKLEKEFWDKIIAVDLTGTFLCSKAVGIHMIKQRHGKIINMASVSGLVVQRLTRKHNPAYSVAKAGVIMLTKVLAGEWAKYNINVNLQDDEGYTAIMYASLYGYIDYVKLLIPQSDLTIRNNDGDTVLDLTTDNKIKRLLRRV